MKRSDETWHVSTRLARVWVFPRKKEPYRPYHMLVLSDNEQVVKAQLVEDQPSSGSVWEYLLKAMVRPMLGGGKPRRPQALTFDDEEISKALAPQLTELGIKSSCQSVTPLLKGMQEDLEKMMNRKSVAIPSLLAIPRVTIPLLSSIFASAADLYRLEPWNKLGHEVPIAVWAPLESMPRYAAISDGSSSVHGLSIHDTLSTLQKMYESKKFKKRAPKLSWLTLAYDHPSSLSFDDLDAIDEYSLAVAGDHAYPLIFRLVTPTEAHPPTTHDLFWLEDALPALVNYFRDDLIEGINVNTPPAEFTYNIKTLDGSTRVKLRLPIILENRS